jgi:hypothetical protein
VFILVAFVAAQAGTLTPQQRSYLVLNLVGGLVLTWVAIEERDWGFLMLEVVWSVVSAWGLVQIFRGQTPSGAH